jgi:hypothetical protein
VRAAARSAPAAEPDLFDQDDPIDLEDPIDDEPPAPIVVSVPASASEKEV